MIRDKGFESRDWRAGIGEWGWGSGDYSKTNLEMAFIGTIKDDQEFMK